jgi:hypothetical protein
VSLVLDASVRFVNKSIEI